MAVTAANLVQDALEVIYGALAAVKTDGPAKAGVQALNEVVTSLNQLPGYRPVTGVALTDTEYAGVSEMLAGEATVSALNVVIFDKALVTDDLTDDVMQTAKTARSAGAMAVGDVWVIDGADSIEYLGNGSGRAFDMSGETSSDFG